MGTLVAMQASGNAAIASVVAVSSLLAADLLGGETLAGLGVGDVHRGRGAGRRAAGAAHAPPGSSPRAGHGLRHRRRRCRAGDDRGPGRVVPALRRRPVPDRRRPGRQPGRSVRGGRPRPSRPAGPGDLHRGVDRHDRRRARTDLRHAREGRRRERRLQPARSDRSCSRAPTSSSPHWSSPSSCGRTRSWWPAASPRRASRGCGGRRRSGARSR